jgi:predicted alpha-1,2-mannosidase
MAAQGAEWNPAPEDFSRWVDPFVGTSATGHTFPAACVPFGLVQAGPDTGNGTWDYCSGYRYGDVTICGFTQTHLNGTGCPDLGDVRILPTAESKLKVESDKLKVGFEKASETAGPGYYAVTLDDGIKVEIAAAEHSAIYRISAREKLRLFVDCAYGIGGKNYAKTITASNVKLDGKAGLSGRNHRRQWVERDYSFVVKFSRECAAVEEMPKSEGIAAPQYVFDFDVGESPLLIKVALSAEGGVEAAERNLAAEIPAWDFDAVKVAARAKWNEVLGRATIEGTDEQKKNWYTSLYHLFIQPNNVADAGKKPFYSTFSCWDTFRAAHPLYTILAPDKAAEFVDSMLEQGRRTGYLPIWTLWGKDNQCMIGTHSVPVIVDWFLKEVGEKSSSSRKEEKIHSPTPTLNSNSYWLAAYAQIKDTLTKPHKGRIKERWDLLDKYGYYPFDEIKGESVSRTMECAYDDWCAGMMAEKLGELGTGNGERDESLMADAKFFFKRAENWRNVFDPSIGLVRGKDTKGNWREPYNPYALGHGADLANDFTEGNAFQYTWHVMQNPQGLVDAMGGREAFVRKLDSLFLQPDTVEGSGCVVDVTGLIGQYVHGNEPSHHVIYFYPQVGHPEKAAERIREVFDKFYIPKPDGLCGNDDCGQMSAWYIFSAMGFYPFNPCGGEYIIGAPQVACAKLKVESGEFKVVARNLSRENKYVKSVTLNGKPITDWKIRHSDIMRGGELVFEMTNASEHFEAKHSI